MQKIINSFLWIPRAKIMILNIIFSNIIQNYTSTEYCIQVDKKTQTMSRSANRPHIQGFQFHFILTSVK